jgi:hypothetical protein
MDKRATPQWRHKERAIDEAAAAFRAALSKEMLDLSTLVPIPPSKSKNDVLYDDRLVRMLRGIRAKPELDVRELVLQRASTPPCTIRKTGLPLSNFRRTMASIKRSAIPIRR